MAEEGRAESLRRRLIPTSAVGSVAFVLAVAVGAAFSGTVLYTYYEFRLDQNEQRVEKFTKGFDDRFNTATKTIEAERENAKADIQDALEPLRRIRAEGDTLEALIRKVEKSVWFVRTLDEVGQPSVGSAFVVASDPDQTLLLTSYTAVRAATKTPGPQVFVRKGDREVKATLWTWDESKDLALLVIGQGNVPKLDFARAADARIGVRVFALSGLGASGGAITQGFVADVSSVAVQHDAAVGQSFQGGPLLTSDGEVLAVASRAYAPLGFASDGVWFGVPIRSACEKVLNCPSGSVAGAGARTNPARATTTTTAPPP